MTTKKSQVRFVGMYLGSQLFHLVSTHVRKIRCEQIDGFWQGSEEIALQQAYTLFDRVTLTIKAGNSKGITRNITGIEVREARLLDRQGNRNNARAGPNIGNHRYTRTCQLLTNDV